MTHVLRSDAQRNLGRVLEAAAEVFAERGADASVDEIARRAGVGHGTVFRRFPTKQALLQAVLLRRLEELTALAGEADFDSFFRAAAETYARDRALVDGLERCLGAPALEDFTTAVERLVAQAQADGVLRRDVSAEDVLHLVPIASRYPAIVLDGLRPPKTELSTT